jgi:hypothetical protein
MLFGPGRQLRCGRSNRRDSANNSEPDATSFAPAARTVFVKMIHGVDGPPRYRPVTGLPRRQSTNRG